MYRIFSSRSKFNPCRRKFRVSTSCGFGAHPTHLTKHQRKHRHGNIHSDFSPLPSSLMLQNLQLWALPFTPADIQANRHTHTDTHNHRHKHTHRQTDSHTNTHSTCRHTQKHTLHLQTHTHTDTHIYTHTYPPEAEQCHLIVG